MFDCRSIDHLPPRILQRSSRDSPKILQRSIPSILINLATGESKISSFSGILQGFSRDSPEMLEDSVRFLRQGESNAIDANRDRFD